MIEFIICGTATTVTYAVGYFVGHRIGHRRGMRLMAKIANYANGATR